MSGRNTVRIFTVVLLVFALCCACIQALAEAAPALRFENEEISIPVKKAVKVAPLAENVEKPKALKYIWTSEDEQIATVQNGTVKGIAAGETTITCSAELPEGGRISGSLKVRVIVPVQSLKIGTKANTKIRAGETLNVDYTIQPENATDQTLTWESSDPNIATVDSTGAVTAVSPGKVTVTAVTNDGSNKKAKVALYIPSLYCETEHLDLNSPEGATLDLGYFGTDWDNDVTVKTTGNAFSHSISKDGSKVTLRVDGETPGAGKIEITDKKDSACRVSVSVSVSLDGVPISKQVMIEKLDWQDDQGHITLRNNTGGTVKEVRMYANFYDADNQVMHCSEEGLAGIGNEMCYYKNYDNGKNYVISGKTLTINIYTKNYVNSARVEYAVYQYTRNDGTIVRIPENGLHWFSSESQSFVNAPELMNCNCYPEEGVLERAGSFAIGHNTREVLGWHAPHLGYHYAGLYISAVDEGSIAEKAGVQANDLIVAVDGTAYAHDAYIVQKGKMKLLEGKSITYTVERYGQEGTIDLILEPPAESSGEQ